MGRFKINGVLAVLLTLQNILIPKYGYAANDGLGPQMPMVRMDNNVIDNGNNYGRGNNNPNNNNNYGPKKSLIIPDNSMRGFRVENVTIRVADVSEEFTCPLFEGKAYESVMSSMDKLTDAMKSTTLCNPSPTMGSVVDNTQKIRDAVVTLKPFFEKPETAYANLNTIESSISNAVMGIDGITQSLASHSFQETGCGKNISANPSFASSLSSLVTSLGPFALLGISMAPGLAVAIKVGALAIVAGASSYNEYQKLTFGQSVDMSDHEQWKAVVQNTCAYSRIVRKMNYIQRFESGLLPNVPANQPKDLSNLPSDIQMKVVSFDLKYRGNQDLGPYIRTAQTDKQRFDDMSEILRMGRIELSRVSSQIGGDVKANPEIACSVGLELARLAKNNTGFPGDIIRSIEMLPKENSRDAEQSYSGLLNAYDRLVEGLLLLRNDSLTSSAAVNECALKTGSLIDVLNRTISTYFTIVQGVANSRESQLLKNPEYRQWKGEYKTVEAQKMMGKQLYSVMKNISDSSAILRSYLNRRQNDLRAVLFGAPNWWNIDPAKAPPVYKWLDYTMDMHEASVKELLKNFEVIRNDLYSLQFRLLKIDPRVRQTFDVTNKRQMDAFRLAANFEGLELKNFNLKNPVSAREHELVCHRLLNAWDTWIQATNHLDSVGVFCDMIDPLIDVMTDKGIVKFCRGTNLDIKSQNAPMALVSDASRVSDAAKYLLMPVVVLYRKSIQQVALTLPAKIKAMNCDISGGR